MDTPTITTPTEGLESTPGSAQETQTIAEPQTVTAPTVDGTQSTSQAQPGTPDYETARQIKNLMKEVRSLKQSLNNRSSEAPQTAPQTKAREVTREELVADPIAAIKKILDGSKGEVREEILKDIQQKESQRQFENKRQEGLRLIETNELIKKDPNGIERMREILEEEDDDGWSLEKFSLENPKKAAQMALKEYQTRFGQGKNAVAPSKAQMQTTATSQTAGGGRLTTDQELTSLMTQIEKMPDLMKDTSFMAKLNALVKKSDMESRVSA